MKRDDALWKAILEDIFDDFLRYFYDDAEKLFDFGLPFEFLDKELDQIHVHEEGKKEKIVDKLVKIIQNDGEEKWVLVHVEVQGYNDKEFEKRMFTYYYRILDRFQKPITAWAIFSDRNPNYHPKEYRDALLGTELIYRFNTYKILDQNEEELRKSNNPFAIVILTVLLELKKDKYNGKELIELKLDIVRNLLNKGFSKKKIRALMNFITYYVRLSPEENEVYKKELIHITGKTYPMGIEEFLLDRERKLGIEIGIEKGIEKGAHAKEIEFVLNLFDDGFETDRISKLTGLDPDQVLLILKENGAVK